MPHLMLRSAAAALLASAPLWTVAPAQAAVQQNFPCDVGLEKTSSSKSSTIDLRVTCSRARTVGVTISSGATELAKTKLAVKADVPRTVSVTVPKVQQVCATVRTGGKGLTICSG